MIAETYYDKALSNYKSAKILYKVAKDDEEQLNIIGYHLKQALELAIKQLIYLGGVSIIKTHDIDQLILLAKQNNIELYLPEYLIDQIETLSNWEMKTRYTLGFVLDINKVEKIMNSIEEYFLVIKDKIVY